MYTGKPRLARVMRYAPTRSLPCITRQYMPAIVSAILMEQAATLPQYTASGSKSTSGIIMSPRPKSCHIIVIGLAVKRVLQPKIKKEKVRYGTVRCWKNLIVDLKRGRHWKDILYYNRAVANIL
jgi:hypothetical protein